MRIAQLAPLAESVPPRLYGGTERVVSWLTEALVARGHDVTLFASGDSVTSARLIPIGDRALRGGSGDPMAAHTMLVAMAKARADEFDVVHSHVDFLPFLAFDGVRPAVLGTMHGRLDLPWLPPLFRQFRDFPLVSISNAQRHPAPAANWVATVYHGLPIDGFPTGDGRGDYLLFLGRMSPEKRPEAAIAAARRAGVRLLLAAKVDDVDRAWFTRTVEPLLSQPGIEFVGEVDEHRKHELLCAARAMLFPIDWPEPFGLAMIEAMACGTPVITRRCGSTPEVVADGVTGFVCDDDAAVVDAIRRIDTIDRVACRRRVEERFAVERMVAAYEEVYERLIAARAARGRAPMKRPRSEIVPAAAEQEAS
jgi:glycosyltransferase involved in cell wall biosynthesis